LPCPSGQQIITTNTLIAGREYSASAYKCQSCPDPLMSMLKTNGVYSCRCPSSYTIVGVSGIGEQSCILTSQANPFLQQLTTASIVPYASQLGITVQSLTMQHYFIQAATYCTYYSTPDSFRYCQMLANLCVLQLYNLDNDICKTHMAVIQLNHRPENVYNLTNWVKGNPWIYFQSTSACIEPNFQSLVSLTRYQMIYVIASYYLNGTFEGFHKIDNFFSFCKRSAPQNYMGGGTSDSTTWQWFGFNYERTFQCEVRSLLNSITKTDEQLLHELYLYDPEVGKYAPVPVRMQNLMTSNENHDFMPLYTPSFCSGRDVLVKRFFLYDVVSGKSKVDGDPDVIRVADQIYLETRRVDKTQSSIYPSVLTIHYQEMQPAEWNVNDDLNYPSQTNDVTAYTVTVAYTINLHQFKATLFIFEILVFLLGAGFLFLRYYNWNKRNSRVITAPSLTSDLGALNWENVLNVCCLMMNTYVLVFFPITVLVCWYFFVFYKLQSVPSVLLPPTFTFLTDTTFYYIFFVDLHVLAAFQIFFVVYKLVYRQANNPVFFIDWEPVKHKHVHGAISSASQKKPFSNAEEGGGGGGGGGHSQDSYQISVWRTVLVANKLLEIQVQRKSNIIFTLFFMAYFLLGLGLDNNKENQPDLNELNNPQDSFPTNMVLRFANTTFLWLALSLFQYLWFYFVYDAYISEPIEQKFIDFCTILKISIFMLDERYHGYYVHCHSSIQYADINMLEVIQMLSKEENGLLMDRSLENAPVDCQSFELFLSGEWYEEYIKLYNQLQQVQSIQDILEYRRQQESRIQQRSSVFNRGNNAQNQNNIWGVNLRYNRLNSSKHQKGLKLGNFYYSHVPNEKLYGAWDNIIHFLKEFIDNNYQKSFLRYNIKERNYYEYMTNDAPNLSTPNQPSILVTDPSTSNYAKCFFLGNELDLLYFNILTYSVYDLWFNNTMVSILLTYLTNFGIEYWRYHLGKVI
jgi:meckelin